MHQPLSLMNTGQVATNSKVTDDPLSQLMASAYAYADSAEQREGITAFLDKRPAVF